MEIVYDEFIRHPNECHWEIHNAVQYYYPQEIGVESTYIGQCSLVKSIGTIVNVRVGKLKEKCPYTMPLVKEGFSRTFFHSKKSLMLLDIEHELYHRMLFNHSRNCGFKMMNRAYELGITPNNFREVVFIDFQNQNHHWKLKDGHSFVRVDLSER